MNAAKKGIWSALALIVCVAAAPAAFAGGGKSKGQVIDRSNFGKGYRAVVVDEKGNITETVGDYDSKGAAKKAAKAEAQEQNYDNQHGGGSVGGGSGGGSYMAGPNGQGDMR
jgi:hypothetical protein